MTNPIRAEPKDASARPRVYLAGPDVFFPAPSEIGKVKREIAARHGLEGVFPLDADLDLTGLSKLEQARRISLANEALMRSCDAVAANISPFRGASMDAGTAFEVGFMRALGRPIALYTTARADYAERARAHRVTLAMGEARLTVSDIDQPDFEIEDFGLAENLMIAIAAHEAGGRVEVEATKGASHGDQANAALGAFERSVAWLSELLDS